MVASRTDLYLSTVANRQGEISKQLTVIASIFLPLSFLTGFFGMNFEWEGGHLLSGVWTFVALGLGSMAVATAAMWWWFRHNGWTRSDEQFGPHIANNHGKGELAQSRRYQFATAFARRPAMVRAPNISRLDSARASVT